MVLSNNPFESRPRTITLSYRGRVSDVQVISVTVIAPSSLAGLEAAVSTSDQ